MIGTFYYRNTALIRTFKWNDSKCIPVHPYYCYINSNEEQNSASVC